MVSPLASYHGSKIDKYMSINKWSIDYKINNKTNTWAFEHKNKKIKKCKVYLKDEEHNFFNKIINVNQSEYW